MLRSDRKFCCIYDTWIKIRYDCSLCSQLYSIQVVKMNTEMRLVFIFLLSYPSKIQKDFWSFFVHWVAYITVICKIIKIACSYKCVNHDMCKIKIKLLEENSKWKILDWQGNLSLLHSLLKVLLPKFCAQ